MGRDLDPSVRSFLHLRLWAYEQQAIVDEFDRAGPVLEASFAAERDQARAFVARGEYERHAAEVERVRPSHARLVSAIDGARILSFPGASLDDYHEAWRAFESIPGIPDPFDLLPFPSCYVAFGDGVEIPPERAGDEAVAFADRLGAKVLVNVGLLATRSGHAWVVTDWAKAGRSAVMAAPVFEHGSADTRDIGFGWLLYLYLLALQDRPLTAARPDVSSLKARSVVDRTRRLGGRPIPIPYYRVEIDRPRFREIVRSATRDPVEWSHRWDVRKHFRHRFLRGTGEIDAATAEKLLLRGYEVHFRPTPEIDAALAVRGMPPQGPDEWVAVKTWDVSEHVRGPEDKPYIPAERVVRSPLQRSPEAR